jgi:EAL and modified HD-GYP domain-containing signal transduction protein
LPQLKTHRVLSIARNVNTLEDFEAARAAGFTYFQGPGWQCPRPDHAAKNVLRSHVLELINLTKVQADVSDLEGVLLRDPLLSYQLLRLVNSAGSGLVQPVRSMAQALMVLGYQPLYRWLVTLLYTAGDHDERAEALLHTALTRARLMESLGGEQLGRAHRDGLYLTGMFSLLDVLLGKPMVEALAGLSLTRPLLEALLDRHGTYAPWLELALALENPAEAPVTEAANRLELSAENLNAAHIDALIWADQVAD